MSTYLNLQARLNVTSAVQFRILIFLDYLHSLKSPIPTKCQTKSLLCELLKYKPI